MRALPEPSTATQKELEGQETEAIPPTRSMDFGADQDEPFQVSALP